MSHYEGKLSELQKSIAKIQQHLKGSKKQRSEVVTELKVLETEISKRFGFQWHISSFMLKPTINKLAIDGMEIFREKND